MAWMMMLVGAGLMGICARMSHRAWSAAHRKDDLVAGVQTLHTTDVPTAEGLVHVRGITGGETLRHPFEDLDVVQYGVRVLHRRRSEGKGQLPTTVREEKRGTTMTLTDDHGTVQVPLQPITIELSDAQHTYTIEFPPAVQAYLDEHASTVETDDDDTVVSVRCDWIPKGIEVGVVGFAEGEAIVSRPAWQVELSQRSIDEVCAAHRSSAPTLKAVTIAFSLLGIAHLAAAAFMAFAD